MQIAAASASVFTNPQECVALLANINNNMRYRMQVYDANQARNGRGPGNTAQPVNVPPVQRTTMQPQPQWRAYFEGLPKAQQRQFAGIFGPQVARTAEDYDILQNALKDDGRVAQLTPMYAPTRVNRRAVMFRNAYLERR